jgi:hypothetical protein
MNKTRVLVIVTEGETDDEFYHKLIAEIRRNNDGGFFKVDELKYICCKSITRFSHKLLKKFEEEVINKFDNAQITVFLCYDTDVFMQNPHPPVNREKLEQDLLIKGATTVYHLKADKTIEDFFLMDMEGIIKYLRLGKKYKIPKNKKGLELLKQMFKDGNKTYFKGERVDGFIDALNISKICLRICPQIKKLCSELGYECNGEKCKR